MTTPTATPSPPSCAPAPGWRPRRAEERLGRIGGRVGAWREPCAAAARLPAGDAAARAYFEAWFVPYLVTGEGGAQGLFTGYYEAELRGAPRPHGPYRVPVYARPPELVTVALGRFGARWKGQRTAGRVADGRLVPFPSRAEIEAGALAGRGLELVWADDAVDVYFLHVQGSGRVRMEDGGVVRLGYDGHNGHAYVAIGRELVAAGAIAGKDLSMQSIRAWLAAHPDAAGRVMARNPSFIFFRAVPGDGPLGAQGAALTPGRSLAVDRRFVPLGVPVWLDTTDPVEPSRPLRRLVVAQDSGGAIKGAVRGDLFWGFGAAAAERAGRMRQTGRYYLLLPRGAGP